MAHYNYCCAPTAASIPAGINVDGLSCTKSTSFRSVVAAGVRLEISFRHALGATLQSGARQQWSGAWRRFGTAASSGNGRSHPENLDGGMGIRKRRDLVSHSLGEPIGSLRSPNGSTCGEIEAADPSLRQLLRTEHSPTVRNQVDELAHLKQLRMLQRRDGS